MNKKILALLTVIVIALCSVVALAADLKELTVDGIDSGDDVGNFIEPLTIYNYEAVKSGRIPRQGHIVRDSAGNVKGYLSDDEYKKLSLRQLGLPHPTSRCRPGKSHSTTSKAWLTRS